jgi:radical SAM protein with 4Fe4S-binding SPASM domain
MDEWEEITEEEMNKDGSYEYKEVSSFSGYDKEKSFNAIRMFTSAGMKQVNIHFMFCEETYTKAFEIVQDIATDPRLKDFNAIVFLAYKPKGRNIGSFHTIKNTQKYKDLIDFCESKKVNYGFDSCSAPTFFKTFEKSDRFEQMALLGEACESTLFSSYINADGKFFPCSFNEGEEDWKEGLDVLKCDDFAKDIWNHPKTVAFRNKLTSTTKGCFDCPSKSFCRTCPTFDMTECV